MNIWAHRGNSYYYPENTLSAFREACEYPIVGIELDVQLSKDGELVVFHDETLERTTNGTGRVCDKSVNELKALHIIANKRSGLEYETIPTLREVLELLSPECKARGLLINIELKNSVIRYEGMEELVLALVQEFDLESYIIYSSFNKESIAMLKKLCPFVKTGILSSNVSKCIEISEQIPVDALHPNVKKIDNRELVAKNNLPVRAWNTREYEPFFPEDREIEKLNLEELENLGVTDVFTNAPELYLKRHERRLNSEIQLDIGWTINQKNGFAERAGKDCCATWHFYKATAGSTLRCKNEAYEYQLFVYALETEERLIYTYCYQEEENWATYCPDKSMLKWTRETYHFEEDCYFRLLVRKCEGTEFEEIPQEEDLLDVDMILPSKYVWQPYFQKESRLTVEAVNAKKTRDSFTLMVVTDSHYVINGTWEDTAYNLKKTAEQIYPDAVVHLGDLTDGMTPAEVTKEYSAKVLGDLKGIGTPVYVCLGNHDANYFRRNPEEMTEKECSRWYLNREEPYYFVDVAEKQMRMFFLFSFDHHEQIRYGFPECELVWLKNALEMTPEGYQILVFSHVPPLPEIHFWSDAIRNGKELLDILEAYHYAHNNCVLAYIHGHNHADQIYTKRAFPIVSLGCNKLEDFKDCKPDGSVTYDRKRGTVSQDLWDVLIVNPKIRQIDFVRFGAGEDKHICWN